MKREDLSCHDADATDPRDHGQDLRRPLMSPGPSFNGHCLGLARGEVGAAAAEAESMGRTEGFKLKEKEGEGPLEAHVEGDSAQSTHANTGKAPCEDPGAGVVEEPLEGIPEDTQDQGQHQAPSAQAQAQDLLNDAARQSEGETHPASSSKSMGLQEGFELEENEEEMIKPAWKLKEEKVNVGEDDSKDGTTSTIDGCYEFGVKPNNDAELAQALRESREEQRSRQQADGGGEQDSADVPATPCGSAQEHGPRR